MNLKRHLERLSQGRAGVPVPPPAAPKSANIDRERTLSELRSRMEVLLARPLEPSQSQQRQKNVDFGALGFELETSTQVPVWRKRWVVSASACVGDMLVTGVGGADAQILSLLALDPALGSCDLEGALFLDTETTGLGGAGTFAFLLGMLYIEGGQTVFEQVLLAGPEQEPAMLELFSARLERASLIVSFNGKAFDWPLLAGRFVMNGLPTPRPPAHLDLLHLARRIHGQRLERCNLKHLEIHVLGYVREEDIEGALVAERYLQYLRSSEASLLGQVIEHNRWDVLSMAALVNLYGQPLPRLPAQDLVSVARTLLRGHALERTSELLRHALEAGAGTDALRVRADLSRARGDHAQRALDLEEVHSGQGCAKLRLELAKLYEHKLRRYERALTLLGEGLAESADKTERRQRRLLRKLQNLVPS